MSGQQTPWYFDCRMCGHVGRVEQLKEHPLRPVDSDFGFCPECAAPVEDPITRQQAIELFADYGEDGLAEVNKLDAAVAGNPTHD